MADYGIQNATHAFNLPSPYQADLAKIAQQQKMAELLQAQSLQPTERYSYKGIEAHTPATAGLAKILQAMGGAYLQNKGLEESKALGERYKTESSDILRKAFEAGAGSPAVPGKSVEETSFAPSGSDLTDTNIQRVPEGQPGQGNIVQPAYTIPGRAAVAPNQQEMARLLMTSPNPAHEALGLQTLQKNAQSQAFINAGNAWNVPATPMAAPTAAPTTAPSAMPGAAPAAAPTAQPAAAALSRFGGPAGGQPMSVWMQLDPTGGEYIKQLAKDFTEQNKPTDKQRELIAAGVKPGSDAWNFALTDTATQGGIWRRGPDGALTLAPGYAAGQGAVTSETERAKAEFDIVTVPITQTDGTTINQTMTRKQATQRLGGNAPQQAGGPLNLTAPTDAAAVQMGRQLDQINQPFNITVPRAGAPTGVPSGFGVSNPVQQKVQETAATGSVETINKRVDASFTNAQTAEDRLKTINNIRPILDLPLITGPGATPQMFLSQVANKMYGVSNEETLSNTRELITGLAELSLSARGALKGQGSITEGETKLLTQARSAPASLTVPEYKRLFTLFEKQDKRIIEQHEDFRKRAEKAGIPNMEVWRVEIPNAQTGQQLKLSPAAQDAVDRAMGRTP
jgi:hypothetical protein